MSATGPELEGCEFKSHPGHAVHTLQSKWLGIVIKRSQDRYRSGVYTDRYI